MAPCGRLISLLRAPGSSEWGPVDFRVGKPALKNLSRVTVEFQPEATQVVWTQGSLLELARRSRVKLRSVCGGQASCSTCRVRVLQGGEFLSPVGPAEAARLPQQRLEQGFRLACQCRPVGAGRLQVAVPTLVEWIRLTHEEEGTF